MSRAAHAVLLCAAAWMISFSLVHAADQNPSVTGYSTLRGVAVSTAGTLVGTEKGVNLIPGTGVTMTAADNPSQKRVDVTVNSTASGGSSGASALEVFSNTDSTRSSPTASVSIGDQLRLTVTASTAAVNIDTVSVAHGGTGSTTASGARTNLGVVIGTDVEAHDTDLTALAGVSSNGLLAHTGSGTAAARTLTSGTTNLTVTNGDGASGNPSLALSSSVATVPDGSSTLPTAIIPTIVLGTKTSGNYVAVANTNASMIGGTTGSAGSSQTFGVDPASGTLQGNSFNAANRLLLLTASGVIAAAQIPTFAGDVTTPGGSLTTTIAGHAVSNAKFRQGAALSVVGVTGNATADVADIAGTANQVFRVNGAGTALGFGAIDLSQSAAVTGLLPAASIAGGSLLNTVIGSSLAANGVSAGTYGSATQVSSVTVGADGRVTSATNIAIAIPISQVSGGSAGANAYDFGSATSLTIPQGTNPSLSSTGQVAVDTSSGQVVASTSGSSGNVVLPYYIPNSIVIATPTVGDYHFFVKAKREWTIDSVVCISSASTSATVQLFECDANGANCTSMDSATACTTTETAITMTDTDITAGDRVKVMVTATSGTPGEVAVDLYALETRK